MGLKSIKLPEAKVELPDGGFAVRGLCLNDISYLVQRHGKKLSVLFNEFATQSELTTESVAHFALPLIQAAPEIAAEIIACGAGESDEDGVAIASTLPFPVQIDALEKIATLTFEAGGGPKKLVETVIRLAHGTTSLLESLKT